MCIRDRSSSVREEFVLRDTDETGAAVLYSIVLCTMLESGQALGGWSGDIVACFALLLSADQCTYTEKDLYYLTSLFASGSGPGYMSRSVKPSWWWDSDSEAVSALSEHVKRTRLSKVDCLKAAVRLASANEAAFAKLFPVRAVSGLGGKDTHSQGSRQLGISHWGVRLYSIFGGTSQLLWQFPLWKVLLY